MPQNRVRTTGMVMCIASAALLCYSLADRFEIGFKKPSYTHGKIINGKAMIRAQKYAKFHDEVCDAISQQDHISYQNVVTLDPSMDDDRKQKLTSILEQYESTPEGQANYNDIINVMGTATITAIDGVPSGVDFENKTINIDFEALRSSDVISIDKQVRDFNLNLAVVHELKHAGDEESKIFNVLFAKVRKQVIALDKEIDGLKDEGYDSSNPELRELIVEKNTLITDSNAQHGEIEQNLSVGLAKLTIIIQVEMTISQHLKRMNQMLKYHSMIASKTLTILFVIPDRLKKKFTLSDSIQYFPLLSFYQACLYVCSFQIYPEAQKLQ